TKAVWATVSIAQTCRPNLSPAHRLNASSPSPAQPPPPHPIQSRSPPGTRGHPQSSTRARRHPTRTRPVPTLVVPAHNATIRRGLDLRIPAVHTLAHEHGVGATRCADLGDKVRTPLILSLPIPHSTFTPTWQRSTAPPARGLRAFSPSRALSPWPRVHCRAYTAARALSRAYRRPPIPAELAPRLRSRSFARAHV
ncbi:hypothetical protein B0H16DRAFT_1570834, partial [Mycena metata]